MPGSAGSARATIWCTAIQRVALTRYAACPSGLPCPGVGAPLHLDPAEARLLEQERQAVWGDQPDGSRITQGGMAPAGHRGRVDRLQEHESSRPHLPGRQPHELHQLGGDQTLHRPQHDDGPERGVAGAGQTRYGLVGLGPQAPAGGELDQLDVAVPPAGFDAQLPQELQELPSPAGHVDDRVVPDEAGGEVPVPFQDVWSEAPGSGPRVVPPTTRRPRCERIPSRGSRPGRALDVGPLLGGLTLVDGVEPLHDLGVEGVESGDDLLQGPVHRDGEVPDLLEHALDLAPDQPGHRLVEDFAPRSLGGDGDAGGVEGQRGVDRPESRGQVGEPPAPRARTVA